MIMPFCRNCGTQYIEGTEFCSNCAAALAAQLTTPAQFPTPLPKLVKASHLKRNLALITIIAIILTAVMTSSQSPQQKLMQAPTAEVKTATLEEIGTVHIGQSFVMKTGTTGVPVEITFTSAKFAASYSYIQAESGYKLLVLEAQIKDVGMEETSVFGLFESWEVTGDNGYTYESKHDPELVTLQPEEVKTVDVVFEILDTTTPVEVTYAGINGETLYVLDLQGLQTEAPPASQANTQRGLHDFLISMKKTKADMRICCLTL